MTKMVVSLRSIFLINYGLNSSKLSVHKIKRNELAVFALIKIDNIP